MVQSLAPSKAKALSKSEIQRLTRLPVDDLRARALAVGGVFFSVVTGLLWRIGWPRSSPGDVIVWAEWILFLGPGVAAASLSAGFIVWAERRVGAEDPRSESLEDIEARRHRLQVERAAMLPASGLPQVERIDFRAERGWLLGRGENEPALLLYDGETCLLIGRLSAYLLEPERRRRRWTILRLVRTGGLWSTMTRGPELHLEPCEGLGEEIDPDRVDLLGPEQLSRAVAEATVGVSEGYR